MQQILIQALLFIWLSLIHSQLYAVTDLHFTQQQNVNLDGEWDFYPGQLIDPTSVNKTLSSNNNNVEKVQLPNSFLTLTGHKDHIGTFQKTFRLPESALSHAVYIYVPYQYGAYRMYVDDHLLIEVGKVGTSDQHQTMMAPKLASFFPSQREVTITIQASSFHHIRGGLENSILIGFNRPILDKFYGQVIPLSVVSGVLLMIGSFMVFFAMFRSVRTQAGNLLLFLGLFILCLSLRSFFAVPFIYTLFTDISWVWGTRFEYLLTELACLFFLIYIYLLPYRLLNPYLLKITVAIICLNVAVTLFAQPYTFQSFFFQSFSIAILVFINLLYAAYRMHKSHMRYSKVNSIAVLLVCLTFLHDYLLALKVIDSVEIGFYTSCIYFILITFQLSRDYAVQSINTEVLNQKLIRWNKQLDQKVQERTRDISLLNQKLAEQVRLDSLTGAYNRFALNEQIQQQYEQALENHSSLAFFMIDVDYFKNYNDYYGHLKGDYILKTLVQTIQQILPENGFLARYGGEEFAVILPEISWQEAEAFAQQLCQVIRQQNIEHANRADEKTWISISVGAAVMDAEHIYRNVDRLLKTADQQLYQAKVQRDSACIK
ncbi:histidine kinase [Acinetobacter sp. LoGeW2-3]|uniref:GGDEF domain-containing protein n=1 Tax=Acinetobacter sp. LoGeW2-3 TaxID=1808001 RepID=UPI000C05B6A8|nr:GGDEF domain-containing protein [Acinetobacter sp. LoGeW2-3]ATO19089.1 histidine kinase [Acinetobacter sp. LoGeW2-3]